MMDQQQKIREFTSRRMLWYVLINLFLVALIIIYSFKDGHGDKEAIFFTVVLFLLLIYGIYLFIDFILVIPVSSDSIWKIAIGCGLLLMLIILVYANLFFQIYRLMDSKAFRFTGDGLAGDDFLYYSVTTFTTTGYGDITPFGVLTNLLAASEMLLGMAANTVFLAVLTSKILFTITRR